jgi:hypothetical protein
MELDTSWCPCQEDRFADTNIEEHDLPYVVDHLQEVKTSFYYEQKRKENRDPNDLSLSPPSPSTPRTRRGTKIVEENFPDADLVCPCCEAGYVEEVERTVYPLGDEREDDTDGTLSDDEWEKIETALKVQMGFVPDGKKEDWRDLLDKVRHL